MIWVYFFGEYIIILQQNLVFPTMSIRHAENRIRPLRSYNKIFWPHCKKKFEEKLFQKSLKPNNPGPLSVIQGPGQKNLGLLPLMKKIRIQVDFFKQLKNCVQKITFYYVFLFWTCPGPRQYVPTAAPLPCHAWSMVAHGNGRETYYMYSNFKQIVGVQFNIEFENSQPKCTARFSVRSI